MACYSSCFYCPHPMVSFKARARLRPLRHCGLLKLTRRRAALQHRRASPTPSDTFTPTRTASKSIKTRERRLVPPSTGKYSTATRERAVSATLGSGPKATRPAVAILISSRRGRTTTWPSSMRSTRRASSLLPLCRSSHSPFTPRPRNRPAPLQTCARCSVLSSAEIIRH